MKLISKILAIGALLALGIGAFAQGRGGFGGRGGGMMSPYMLLRDKNVQTDIKLSDDQNKKLTDIQTAQQDEMRQAFQNSQASGGPPDRDAMTKMMSKYTDEIKAVLTPDQDTRLHQIFIQWRGPQALTDTAIQDQLGLSADQKSQITDLMSKYQAANQEVGQKVRDGEITREDAAPIQQKNTDALKDNLGKILTPDQASKLKDMGGTPITYTIQMPRGRRGGGGGGGGGTGGGGGGISL